MKLVLDDIGYSYDRGLPTERVVLDSLALEVVEGEFLSIVGRTGSGKTTLGLIMAGLLKPTKGSVLLDPGPSGAKGADGAKRPDVVMVFQFPESQFFEENVFGELAFGPSRLGLDRDEIRRRVVWAAGKMKLDLETLSNRPTVGLSEGEKRKVAIASALSCGPRFLVLDEPTVSLDWEASLHIFEVLGELRRTGVSVVMVTHEVEEAVSHSDRVAVLADGRLAATGKLSADEVYCLLS